jgi:hypothetical protein
LPEPTSPRERERQHPLAQIDLGGEYALHEIRRRRAHAPAQARRTEPAAFARESNQPALVAPRAAQAREASAQQAAIEKRLELLLGVLGQPHIERAIVDCAVERLEVVAHELIQRRRFLAVALVADVALTGIAGRKAHANRLERLSCRPRTSALSRDCASQGRALSWRPPPKRLAAATGMDSERTRRGLGANAVCIQSARSTHSVARNGSLNFATALAHGTLVKPSGPDPYCRGQLSP